MKFEIELDKYDIGQMQKTDMVIMIQSLMDICLT